VDLHLLLLAGFTGAPKFLIRGTRPDCVAQAAMIF
jgi:hypothetical protein